MQEQLEQLLFELANFAELGVDERAGCRRRAAQAALSGAEEAERFLQALAALAARQTDAEALREEHSLWSALVQAVQRALSPGSVSAPTIQSVVDLYRWLGPASLARHALLRLLAAEGSPAAWQAFVEQMVADPPSRAQDAVLAFVPLFQRRNAAAKSLFPQLLDALEHPSTAAVVLDLANFLCRERGVVPHPANSRGTQLADLLGGVVARLARLEEQPREFAGSPAALNAMVSESVELVVALCHALGMIGDESAGGKLRQALQLAHRRLRTEAAFALARLGDEEGLNVLAEMAGEPVVRPRALAYLEELGQLARANEADCSPVARAEGELAAALAAPTQFGLPPHQLELVDSRRQFWPGYDEAVDCYLFRYEYRAGDRSASGIAMAGPLTHALQADLADLPPADIYAAYAGWFAEHEEISELSPDQLSAEQQETWDELAQQLAEQGCEDVQLVKLGRFFDEEIYIAASRRDGQPGILMVDAEQTSWHPLRRSRRSLGPDELYWIHKGRKLMRAFNPEE